METEPFEVNVDVSPLKYDMHCRQSGEVVRSIIPNMVMKCWMHTLYRLVLLNHYLDSLIRYIYNSNVSKF